MKIVEMEEATASLAEYVRQLDDEPMVVMDNGKPVAALVTIEDADLETVSLSINPKFLAIIERSRARQQAEGGIPSEEMRRRLGIEHQRETPCRSHADKDASASC